MRKMHLLAMGLMLGTVVQANPNYISMNRVESELHAIDSIWQGRGHVVVGKIENMSRDAIASRTRLLPDGSFVTRLYPGRTLTFYAHGYDALTPPESSEVQEKVYDTGTISFQRTAPENLRSLKAIVSVSGAKNALETPVKVRLYILNDAYLYRDHGYAGDPISVTVDTLTMASGGSFSFSGLSPIPYRIELTCPGFIKQDILIDPEATGTIDLGEIEMQAAPVVEFRYRARIKQKDQDWLTDQEVKSATVECNGSNEFQFTAQRDGIGNKLKLRLSPTTNGIESSFFFWEDSFYDLGEVDIDSIETFSSLSLTDDMTAQHRILLQDGHLYLFRIKNVHQTDIDLLFQPTLKTAEE